MLYIVLLMSLRGLGLAGPSVLTADQARAAAHNNNTEITRPLSRPYTDTS